MRYERTASGVNTRTIPRDHNNEPTTQYVRPWSKVRVTASPSNKPRHELTMNVSGWAFAGLSTLGLGMTGVSVVALPLAALWIALAVYLGRREERLREGA